MQHRSHSCSWFYSQLTDLTRHEQFQSPRSSIFLLSSRYLLNDHDVMHHLRASSTSLLVQHTRSTARLSASRFSIISRTFARVSSPSRFALHFDDVASLLSSRRPRQQPSCRVITRSFSSHRGFFCYPSPGLVHSNPNS